MTLSSTPSRDETLQSIQQIQQKIVGVHPAKQRAVLISEWMASMAPEAASPLFSAICVQPCTINSPGSIVLAEAVFGSLIYGLWPQEHQRYTREAAASMDEEVTLTFLNEPQKVDQAEESFALPKYSTERVLTLGERKSLAAVPSRQTVEKAMMDPHPEVAKKLLANPKMTEADVVRISAKAHMAPSVLCEIAAHPKWRKQRMVQKALVNNKLLPPDYSLTLLPFLNRQSIREVSRDQRLHESVQHAAGLLVSVVDSRSVRDQL